jgi:hypothetical protein
MGTVLVIGGDRLGNIPDVLQYEGFQEIYHVTGRKNSQTKMKIPVNTKMIVVFTDYVNHNLSTHIKHQAKEKNVPVLFCKRSRVSITKALR